MIFARLAGPNDLNGLRCADYTCEMIPILGTNRTGLPTTLALLNQGQNGGNCVFEFGDPADDGGRGQPRLLCRLVQQSVLRLLEAVEQGSEVGRRSVHASPAVTGAPPSRQSGRSRKTPPADKDDKRGTRSTRRRRGQGKFR